MTSEAVDKFKHREKKKKAWGREKTYLIIVTSLIIFCALGSIATFTKSKILGDTPENNDEMNTEEDEVEHDDLEEENDEEDEGYEDYEEADEDNSDDYEYDDWTETYFGEEIWVG